MSCVARSEGNTPEIVSVRQSGQDRQERARGTFDIGNMMPSKPPGAVHGVRGYVALAKSFSEGSSSPREYLEQSLGMIAEKEPYLHCFETLSLARARVAADAATKRWASGCPRSRIDGMPIGIKDIIDVADMPTSMGSPSMERYKPVCDAAAVYALRTAGAVILGKTKTTEFANTFPTDTRNPHDLTRTPGGSSSGSAAAVAAGMLPSAIGTQVIGSILRPASFCGVFGYKPTFGAINRGGSHESILSHSVIGVLGASLEDTWATAYQAAADAGGDPGHEGLTAPAELAPPERPTRLAVLETPGWRHATDAAHEQIAGFLSDCSRAGVAVLSRHDNESIDRLEARLDNVLPQTVALLNFEQRWPVNALAHRDPDGLSDEIKAHVRLADELGIEGYRRLLSWRAGLRAEFRKAMLEERVDAFVALTACGAAPRGLEWTGDPTLTVAASVLGLPALSLPAFEDDGLPLGLQLIGREGEDYGLFSYARWCESRGTVYERTT